jgi:hypothetical protein
MKSNSNKFQLKARVMSYYSVLEQQAVLCKNEGAIIATVQPVTPSWSFARRFAVETTKLYGSMYLGSFAGMIAAAVIERSLLRQHKAAAQTFSLILLVMYLPPCLYLAFIDRRLRMQIEELERKSNCCQNMVELLREF